MSSDDDKNRMVDEGLVYWADTIRRAIREIDPTALATVGFFTPNEPNPVNGPDETRLVRTAYFLRNSEVDSADLHHYRGSGVDDADIWDNFGIAGVEEMPLVLGEHGGFRNWYSSIDRAATAVMGLGSRFGSGRIRWLAGVGMARGRVIGPSVGQRRVRQYRPQYRPGRGTYQPTGSMCLCGIRLHPLGIDLVRAVSISVGDLWHGWHEIELLAADPPP